MRSNLVTRTLFFSLLGTTQAVAGSPLDTEGTMEEVVVTATRFPEKRASVPAFISVITSEEIRKSTAATVPDLLRHQAGVFVTDMTGNGRNFSVDLRGFGENAAWNTLVLVDGRRINQADMSMDWLQIPLERVEKIEIIRGGGAGVLYGDNASGGVINIITRGGGQSQGDAKIEAGSYGTMKTHIGFSGIRDELAYALSLGYRTSDGYRDNSDTEARDIGLKLTHDWNDDFALNFSAGYQKDDARLPGSLGETELSLGRRATNSPNDLAKTEDYFFHGGPEWHFGEDNLFKMDMSFRHRTSEFSGSQWIYQPTIDTWSVAPRMQITHQMGAFSDKLTFGMDYQSDVDEIYTSYNSAIVFLEKNALGYYLHNELRFPYRWRLTTGYRMDTARFQFAPNTPDQVSLDEDAFSAGIIHDLDDNSQIYLNFSRSFRYPLLDEYGQYDNNTKKVNINAALLPQRAEEYQLGFHYGFSRSLQGDINLFRVNTDREIFLNKVSANLPFGNSNLDGRVRRDGLGMSLEKQFEKWKWRGSYTWTEATILDGTFAEKEFPGVPKHKAGMALGFSPTDELTVTLSGNFIGTQRFISDFSNQFEKQSSYLILDTSLRYRWPKVTGFFNVTNLTGKEYSEFGVLGGGYGFSPLFRAYYPSPERRFMAGISAHF